MTTTNQKNKLDILNLRTYTAHGSFNSLISVDQLMDNDMPVVSIIDKDMFNVVNFYQNCIKHNKKPIIGIEFNHAWGDIETPTIEYGTNWGELILIAKNTQGYKNLVALSTKSYNEGMYQRARIDIRWVKSHSEGLICCI